MKKMVKVLVFVLAVCLIPSFCFAANPGFYTCTVGNTGVGAGGTFAYLTDTAASPKFTNTPFYLDSSNTNTKSLLAVALTAISLGKTVSAYVNSTSNYSNCSTMFLIP
jgi:predicted ribosomally synthesized peptide with SipW-like signal peptide